jgi:recombination protein RecA
MEDFKKFIEKEFGKDVIASKDTQLKAISTGSLALDLAIGVGGIPKSKFTEMAGSEGTGKTTIALETCKNAIMGGDSVLYVDPENMLDLIYAKVILGEYYDTEKFIVVQPETGEDALLIVEEGLKQSEEQNIGLIVLDSIGALAPRREKEKDLDDATVAEVARLLSKFLRRVAFFVRRHEVAVLFLNQVRDKVGSYMGGYETPGGHAIKHMCAVRITLKKGRKIEGGKDKGYIGVETPFTIIKNKVSIPYRSFKIPIIFGVGIDRLRDVIGIGKMLGVLQSRGPYIKLKGGDTIGLGIEATKEELRKNKVLLDKIKEMCYNYLYGEEEDDAESEPKEAKEVK